MIVSLHLMFKECLMFPFFFVKNFNIFINFAIKYTYNIYEKLYGYILILFKNMFHINAIAKVNRYALLIWRPH